LLANLLLLLKETCPPCNMNVTQKF
jgi:hypothetical protein